MANIRLLVILSAVAVCTGSSIQLSEGGGYSNIVIKIRKELNEADCPAILKGIKVVYIH